MSGVMSKKPKLGHPKVSIYNLYKDAFCQILSFFEVEEFWEFRPTCSKFKNMVAAHLKSLKHVYVTRSIASIIKKNCGGLRTAHFGYGVSVRDCLKIVRSTNHLYFLDISSFINGADVAEIVLACSPPVEFKVCDLQQFNSDSESKPFFDFFSSRIQHLDVPSADSLVGMRFSRLRGLRLSQFQVSDLETLNRCLLPVLRDLELFNRVSISSFDTMLPANSEELEELSQDIKKLSPNITRLSMSGAGFFDEYLVTFFRGFLHVRELVVTTFDCRDAFRRLIAERLSFPHLESLECRGYGDLISAVKELPIFAPKMKRLKFNMLYDNTNFSRDVVTLVMDTLEELDFGRCCKFGRVDLLRMNLHVESFLPKLKKLKFVACDDDVMDTLRNTRKDCVVMRKPDFVF